MYILNIDGGYSINFCITEEIDDKTIKKIERICNKISKAHTEDLKTLTLVRTQSGQKRGIVENLFNEFTQKVKNETNISFVVDGRFYYLPRYEVLTSHKVVIVIVTSHSKNTNP